MDKVYNLGSFKVDTITLISQCLIVINLIYVSYVTSCVTPNFGLASLLTMKNEDYGIGEEFTGAVAPYRPRGCSPTNCSLILINKMLIIAKAINIFI